MMEETGEGPRAVPFYGRNQVGIATAPQTAAGFLAFDVTTANRGALTALSRALRLSMTYTLSFSTRWTTP